MMTLHNSKYALVQLTRRLVPALMIVATGSSQSFVLAQTEIKLLSSDGVQDDYFGFSISISGYVAIVGAWGNDDKGRDSGSAYLFETKTGKQIVKLLAPDGEKNDKFGYSVAINGSTAIVGAPRKKDFGSYSGAAYLFNVKNGNQITKLLATDEQSGDEFGWSVSISGNTAIVGAPWDDDNGPNSGSVYVFDAATGTQINKLISDDGQGSDRFGDSVAISGTTAIVGAPQKNDFGTYSGAAYLFDTITGKQIAKLIPNDSEMLDNFGVSVAISENTAIVGSSSDDDNGFDSGSAYLFDATTGKQIAKLLAADGRSLDHFGQSVAISGTNAIVGAPDNDNTTGSAYLFDTITGIQIAKLLSSDGEPYGSFGASVAMSGTMVAVGAYSDSNDNGFHAGSAYLYKDINVGCLNLVVDNLIAGQQALFTITNGTPGKRVIAVYGRNAGNTIVNNISRYCATFDIQGVKIIGKLHGLNRVFNANGEITFNQFVPANAAGVALLFQAAEQGTCPDECVSNLVVQIIQ